MGTVECARSWTKFLLHLFLLSTSRFAIVSDIYWRYQTETNTDHNAISNWLIFHSSAEALQQPSFMSFILQNWSLRFVCGHRFRARLSSWRVFDSHQLPADAGTGSARLWRASDIRGSTFGLSHSRVWWQWNGGCLSRPIPSWKAVSCSIISIITLF